MSTNDLATHSKQKVGSPLPVAKRMGDIIGANVARVREQRKLSVAELARRVGVALFTIQHIEAGKTQKSKYLPDIARILEVPLAEIDPSQTTNSGQPDEIPKRELVGERDLPVYSGVISAGETLMSTDPVDRADRPASLAHVRDAYGLIVPDDSMGPVLRPGDIVVVHPHKQPRPEDLIVLRNARRFLIREYVSSADQSLRLRRYRPSVRTESVQRADWPNCHVVVTIHRR